MVCWGFVLVVVGGSAAFLVALLLPAASLGCWASLFLLVKVEFWKGSAGGLPSLPSDKGEDGG